MSNFAAHMIAVRELGNASIVTAVVPTGSEHALPSGASESYCVVGLAQVAEDNGFGIGPNVRVETTGFIILHLFYRPCTSGYPAAQRVMKQLVDVLKNQTIDGVKYGLVQTINEVGVEEGGDALEMTANVEYEWAEGCGALTVTEPAFEAC